MKTRTQWWHVLRTIAGFGLLLWMLPACLPETSPSSSTNTDNSSNNLPGDCSEEEPPEGGGTGNIWSVSTDGTGQEIVVPNVPRPWRVAVDSEWVYFTEIAAGECMASLKRKSRMDSNAVAEVLVDGMQEPGPLFLNDGFILVSDFVSSGSVFKVNLAVNPPTVTEVISDRDFPFDVIEDSNGDIYYTTGAGLERYSPGTGAPVVVIELDFAVGFAIDDTFIYALERESSTNGMVFRLRKDGLGPVEVLVAGLVRPNLPVLESGDFYFSEYSPTSAGSSTPDGRILRIRNVATCVVPCDDSVDVLAGNLNGPRELEVDNLSIYFTEIWEGSVNKIPKDGGDVDTLSNGHNNPFSLAVESTKVFFTELGNISCCFF